ncbi:uncharacterized protein TNCT_435441 [Trichonephila clavata]|uniref:Uncharacterized protein n=1 Tax=Trichonephila clavata TaxID=2740835 RepID=A0A8X6GUP8_TRICU|nr:uncharacterized protein TNCT_435441 [Trichonephila clavata]
MDESKIDENLVGCSKDFSQNELHIADENTSRNSDALKLIVETCQTTWFTYLSKFKISQVKNIKSHFTGNQLNSKSLSCGTPECQEASSFLNGSATEMQQKKVNLMNLNPKPCVKEGELKTSLENQQPFLCHCHKLDASSFEYSNKVVENVTSYISSSKEGKCFCRNWEFSPGGHFSSTSLEKISDPRLNPIRKRKSDVLEEIPLKRVKWNKTSNTKPSSCSKNLNQKKNVYSPKFYQNKNACRSNNCSSPTKRNDKIASVYHRPTDPRLQHSRIFSNSLPLEKHVISLQSSSENCIQHTPSEDSAIIPKKMDFSPASDIDRNKSFNNMNLSTRMIGYSLNNKSPIIFNEQNNAAITARQFDGTLNTTEDIYNCDIKTKRYSSIFKNQRIERHINQQLSKSNFISASAFETSELKTNVLDSCKNQMSSINNTCTPSKVSRSKSRWDSAFCKQSNGKHSMSKPQKISTSRGDCAFHKQSNGKYNTSKRPKSESKQRCPFKEQNQMKNNSFPFCVTYSKSGKTKNLKKNNVSSYNDQHCLTFSEMPTNEKNLINNKIDQQKNNSLNHKVLNSNADSKDIKTLGLDTVIFKKSSTPKNCSSKILQTETEVIAPNETTPVICKIQSQNVKEIRSVSSYISSKNARSVCDKPSYPNHISLKEKFISKHSDFNEKWKKHQKSNAKLNINHKLFSGKNKLKSSIQKDLVSNETSYIQLSEAEKIHFKTFLKLHLLGEDKAYTYKQYKITSFKIQLKLASRLNWNYYISFICANIITFNKSVLPITRTFTNIFKKFMQNPFLKHLTRHSNCGLNGDLKAMFHKIFKKHISNFLIEENENKAHFLQENANSRYFSIGDNNVAESVTTIREKSVDLNVFLNVECNSKKVVSVSNNFNTYQLNEESSFVLLYNSLSLNEVVYLNMESEVGFSTLTNRLSLIWKDFLPFTKFGFYFELEFFKKEHFIDVLRKKGISFPNVNSSTFLNAFLTLENGPISKNWLSDILFNSCRKYIFSLNIKCQHPELADFNLKHLSNGNIYSCSSSCSCMFCVKNKTHDHQNKMIDLIKQVNVEVLDISGSKSSVTDIVHSDIQETSEVFNVLSNRYCEQFIQSKYIPSELLVTNSNIEEEEEIESEECGYTKSLMNPGLQLPSGANNSLFDFISTVEILNAFENDKILEISEHQNIFQPNVSGSETNSLSFDYLVKNEKNHDSGYRKSNETMVSVITGEKSTDSDFSTCKENIVSLQRKDNLLTENYSENEISSNQKNDPHSKKLFSSIFTSNCTLREEKTVSSLQIDAVFQDLDLFKQGGVLFHYYQHLKEPGDHTLNLNEINEDTTDLNEEVLESYNFLKGQLNYHKDMLRGLVHISSEPGTCFNANLIHKIVLQLEYIEGYELACKAILL